MTTTAKGKTSEAQRIIDELIDSFGMQGAAIAREIGVKADTIQNIKGRRATGNLQLHRLRILRDQMLGAADVHNAAQAGEPSSAPLSETFAPVADLFAPVQDGPEPAGAMLNAEEPAPAEAKKLTERASDWLRAAMLGSPVDPSSPGMTAPSRSKKTKGEGVEQGELVEQIVPLAALLLVVSGSVLLPDPYKPCGPRHEEATAMVYPLVKRAVRELDARRKLSEATTDAIAILLAVGAYGVRAHATYQAIHAEEVQRARSSQSQQPTAASVFVAQSGPGAGAVSDARAGAGSPTAATANDGAGHQIGVARAGTQRANNRDAGAATNGHDRAGDAAIADLLAADAVGRKRLGY